MNNANFVAVDFETATANRASACQVGIVVVKDGQIVKRISRLIQPPRNRYSPLNVSIHHITPEKTRNAPTFDIVWDEIGEYFDQNFIVAHNISFDMSVLCKSLEEYDIPCPIFMGTACTCTITGGARLDQACEEYDIPLPEHHDALCDAEACAQLFLKYLDGEIDPESDLECECDSDYDFDSDLDSDPECETRDVREQYERTEPIYYHEKISGDLLKKDLAGANPDNPFYDKKVVITGEFSIVRSDLAKQLKSMGADIDTGITKRTDFVLIGKDPGPKKLEKIESLNADGCSIKKVYEPELLCILSEY